MAKKQKSPQNDEEDKNGGEEGSPPLYGYNTHNYMKRNFVQSHDICLSSISGDAS